MQDLADAGLPLPAVNQIAWQPGALAVDARGTFVPYPRGPETFASLRAWCRQHRVLVNGFCLAAEIK